LISNNFTPESRQALKSELDAVVALQLEIEEVEESISTARSAVASGGSPQQAIAGLSRLRQIHSELVAEVMQVFNVLNVASHDVDVSGLPAEFIRLLWLAQTAKKDLRKRAISKFLQYSRLDQAVQRRGPALGTSYTVL
jgi:hypothetical protein